mmetsp:Transcript_15874/g.33303  ORF Transcript_15874/g.33303 Transcript_15874/m.33303 type:complete len:248 (+) Transcript_15874:1626-2369(+)
MLLGANNGGNPHGGIVHGHAKVVHGHTRRAEKDKITDGGFRIPRDGSANGIVYDDTRTGRDLESNGVGYSLRHLLSDDLGIGISPRSIVTGWDSLGFHFGFHDIEFFRGAETGVGFAFIDEALGDFGVEGGTFGLAVGTVFCKGHVGSFVPGEAEPFEVSNYGLFAFFRRPSQIRIFHTKDKSPLVINARKVKLTFLRHQPIIQRGPSTTDMKRPGRRRSKTHTWWQFHHILSLIGEKFIELIHIIR